MRVDDLHKRCPKCGEVKALADFQQNNSKTKRVQTYCRPCSNEVSHKSRNKTLRNAQIAATAHEREARRAAEDLREARALARGDPW